MKGPIRRGSGDFTGADPRCTEVNDQGARCWRCGTTEDVTIQRVEPTRTEVRTIPLDYDGPLTPGPIAPMCRLCAAQRAGDQ